MLRLGCEGFMGHVNAACNDFGKISGPFLLR